MHFESCAGRYLERGEKILETARKLAFWLSFDKDVINCFRLVIYSLLFNARYRKYPARDYAEKLNLFDTVINVIRRSSKEDEILQAFCRFNLDEKQFGCQLDASNRRYFSLHKCNGL